MRVLQFGRFWNDQHGGVERHAALLSRGLADRGVEVVNLVASANLRGSDGMHDGYRLVQAPSFGMAFRTAMAPALVVKAMAMHRERPFDIFHLHLQDPLTHLTSALLPSSVARVITWHHDIVRQKYLLRLYRPFLQRLLRQADAIVAATPAHFERSAQIPSDLQQARLHVIPYGLDYASLGLDERVRLLCDRLRQRANGRSVIFALGRHVAYKGFDVLIEAMRQVDGLLLLGGSGPLTPVLQRQVDEYSLQDRVHFCGRIPEEELAAYFHACDVFCLPSVTEMEAFGLVQLEAMACGRPVVCTQLHNGVNVVNVHGETGLAVPPRDPVALGQALCRLISDASLRERLGRQGQRRALEIYSLQSMTDGHLQLYQALLSARR